jgi:hypothetical protein
MTGRADLRPALAATVLLAVLACAYKAGQQLLMRPIVATLPAAARPAVVARPDTLAAPAAVAPAEQETPCVPQRRRFLPVLRRLVLHRYVGTVGGEPATALLQWYHPDSITGSFYWHRRGPEYGLASWPGRRGPVLAVVDDNITSVTSEPAGEWHLAGRPGAVLRGTWHEATGRHPFVLHESYIGAVQAEVRTLWLHGGRALTQSGQTCQVPYNRLDYLYLPAPLAVAPTLRRAIGRPLATCRRQMQHELTENDERESVISSFQLNDFGLLAYQVARRGEYFADGRSDSWTDSFLFDLVSGRSLDLASQLRPGYAVPLQRLLGQHLRQRYVVLNKARQETWLWEETADPASSLPGLPEHIQNGDTQGLFLVGAGLEARYPASQLYFDALQRGDIVVRVSYPELRPLVRPGTPLARMLRARGLW